MLKLAVTGACGRMGQRIVALARGSGDFAVDGALEYAGHERLGEDAGVIAGIGPVGVAVSEALSEAPEVMIDFSVPTSTEKWLAYCVANRVPMVIGTTGMSDAQREAIAAEGQSIPIVFAANMSLGVNLLFTLAGQVARVLDDAYDIEITEMHHRFKRDAPSGTAIDLARQIAASKGWQVPDCLVHGREGGDALRQEKTIGMHAVRAGDTVGVHNVIFSTQGETVELRHTAHTRDTFVRGALHAAQWVVRQKPELYSMFDVLGL